jgi:exopolyphosphatase/guanosine-5'-triphosphate,3'-diphosphate pyrophosphatase
VANKKIAQAIRQRKTSNIELLHPIPNPPQPQMINIRKYAAIDIGSNAMRLLVANIIEEEGKETQFSKSSLVRVPIRLGQDAFTVGEISDENIGRMTDAMKAYKLLMKVHKVEKYMACATSAMREAYNGRDVAEYISKHAGIDVEIIDGKTEAKIIASTDLHFLLKTEQTYLYVDVGGGSTEFSLFANGKLVASRSFKIGTVRLLNEMVNHVVWEEIEKWITQLTGDYDHISLIGSGGNINRIFKMSGKLQDTPLSYIYLHGLHSQMSAMSYEQRVYELGLNPDRADVIIPALEVYLNAMKWSGARQIYVPKIGLSDGIIKALYYGRI